MEIRTSVPSVAQIDGLLLLPMEHSLLFGHIHSLILFVLCIFFESALYIQSRGTVSRREVSHFYF